MALGGSRRRLVGESNQHEIGDARHHGEAEGGDILAQPRQPMVVVGARGIEVSYILERRDAGRLRRRGDVERLAQPVEHVGDRRRAIRPAETERGEAVRLRKGPGHHHGLIAIHEFEARRVVIAFDELGVRRIDHEQHVVGQALAQAHQSIGAEISPGRVVGIGHIDDAGARADMIEQGPHVGPVRGLRRRHRARPDARGREPVDEKAILRVQHLVAGSGVGPGEQVEQLVGTVAADDARRIESVPGGDGIAQALGRAVRITVQLAGDLAISGDRSRAWPQRRFVGRQPDDLLHPRDGAATAHIGDDVENARPRREAGSRGELSHRSATDIQIAGVDRNRIAAHRRHAGDGGRHGSDQGRQTFIARRPGRQHPVAASWLSSRRSALRRSASQGSGSTLGTACLGPACSFVLRLGPLCCLHPAAFAPNLKEQHQICHVS